MESGFPIRQTRAVTHAPRPKKKMKKPGMTNSSRNRTRPIRNQNNSGLEKMFAIITNRLNCYYKNCFV